MRRLSVFPPGGRGREEVLLYFHIHFFFQKTEYFGGSEDFVDIFLGYHKIGLYLEIISMHFRFLKVKVQNGGYFLGC